VADLPFDNLPDLARFAIRHRLLPLDLLAFISGNTLSIVDLIGNGLNLLRKRCTFSLGSILRLRSMA